MELLQLYSKETTIFLLLLLNQVGIYEGQISNKCDVSLEAILEGQGWW